MQPNCPTNEHIGPQNNCVPNDCSVECSSGSGFFYVSSGQCVCSDVKPTTDDYCDSTCQNTALKLTVKDISGVTYICASDGTNEDCKTQADFASAYNLDFSGSTLNAGSMTSLTTGSGGGLAGTFEAPANVVAAFQNQYPYTSPYSGARRRLQANESEAMSLGDETTRYPRSL